MNELIAYLLALNKTQLREYVCVEMFEAFPELKRGEDMQRPSQHALNGRLTDRPCCQPFEGFHLPVNHFPVGHAGSMRCEAVARQIKLTGLNRLRDDFVTEKNGSSFLHFYSAELPHAQLLNTMKLGDRVVDTADGVVTRTYTVTQELIDDWSVLVFRFAVSN